MPIANCRLPIVAGAVALAVQVAVAQESPMPSPTTTATATSTATATPTPSPARTVRISFLPPPLEGTISLGIFDAKGKLVRALHEEANLDEFTIGEDSLVTKWDGRDDDDRDSPPGKYHARGYVVGHLKIANLGKTADSNAGTSVKVKLVPNPLIKSENSVVDLSVGFDADGSYLQTTDGLRLISLSETPNLMRTSIARRDEKSVDIWQNDGAVVEQFRVSNIDKMMAFDCGEVELK
jgi:hypothetical protein